MLILAELNILQKISIEGAIAFLIFLASGVKAYKELKKHIIETINEQNNENLGKTVSETVVKTVAPMIGEAISKELAPLIDEIERTKNKTDALVAFRLERECDRAIRRGYTSESGREAIIKLQTPYLDSGQNGAIKDKCERTLHLPTVTDEEFNRRLGADCYYLDALARDEREE